MLRCVGSIKKTREISESAVLLVNNIAIRPFDYHIVDDPDIRFGVFPTLLQSGEMRNVGFYFTIALNAPNIRMKNLTLLDPQLS